MKLLSRSSRYVIFLALALSFTVANMACINAQPQMAAHRLAALEPLDQHLVGHARDVQAKFERATALAQQGLDDEAMDTFQALIQQYPELPEPYNNLAALYAKQGQYEKARVTLETAIRANPNYRLAYQNLGTLYLRLAAAAYQRAVSLDARNNSHDKLSVQRQQQIQAILNLK